MTRRLVVSAAAQAQRASDMVIQPSREAGADPHPEPDQETKTENAAALRRHARRPGR